jgi:hypothetical protein
MAVHLIYLVIRLKAAVTDLFYQEIGFTILKFKLSGIKYLFVLQYGI